MPCSMVMEQLRADQDILGQRLVAMQKLIDNLASQEIAKTSAVMSYTGFGILLLLGCSGTRPKLAKGMSDTTWYNRM